ncbi:MAG: hypothetical protein RL491_567 [Bacteroidota bacterium]
MIEMRVNVFSCLDDFFTCYVFNHVNIIFFGHISYRIDNQIKVVVLFDL